MFQDYADSGIGGKCSVCHIQYHLQISDCYCRDCKYIPLLLIVQSLYVLFIKTFVAVIILYKFTLIVSFADVTM